MLYLPLPVLSILGVWIVTFGLVSAADSGFSADDPGFIDPSNYGERLLGWWDHGYGEPLNAVLSNKSHPSIVSDLSSWATPSFNHYFLAHYYSDECLGLSGPGKMVADLKDGKGSKQETGLKRWTFGDDYIGVCIQTFSGGSHFRYWKQNTITDNMADGTGAVFMAISSEKDLSQKHDIIADGYNLGRDYLVGNLTQQTLRTSNEDTESGINVTIIDESVDYHGTKTLDGVTYKTTVRYVSKKSEDTREKVNHADKVAKPGDNPVDGLIAVITVEIEENQNGASTLSSSRTFTALIMGLIFATASALL